MTLPAQTGCCRTRFPQFNQKQTAPGENIAAMKRAAWRQGGVRADVPSINVDPFAPDPSRKTTRHVKLRPVKKHDSRDTEARAQLAEAARRHQQEGATENETREGRTRQIKTAPSWNCEIDFRNCSRQTTATVH